MQEADADSRFTAGSVTRRGNAGFGVLRDVGVELFQVIKGLIFAPQLSKGRQRGVGGTGALRVSNLDFALVFRFGQIPHIRLRVFLLCIHFRQRTARAVANE